MSMVPEQSSDIVAVACVVEGSLLVASEWTRILMDYVSPLLRRLSELHPSHQFRLGFVTYGAADTRPQPLLSKRFFAPLSSVTKELRDEPSKLGIGQTNSGSNRGLSALEGLVAAIELFDVLMASTNSNQKENRSLIFHILHIAASIPDKAQRPQWNTFQHLDFVNWDSIATEMRKRKINLSLISLRKISQFQDLYSAVAGSGTQSPWFNVHTPHVLSLTGFPTPQKGVKRQTETSVSEHSPDAKRQKVVADPVSTASASPTPSSARLPQNHRTQQSPPSQVAQPQPTSFSPQNTSSAQPVPASVPVPASMSSSTSSGPSLAASASMPNVDSELLEQVISPSGMKFGEVLEQLKKLERIILVIDSKIPIARDNGQTDILALLQKERADKGKARDKLKAVLRSHYVRFTTGKEALNAHSAPPGSAPPGGLAEAGSATQSHPSNAPSSEPSAGSSTEAHKSAMSDAQIVTQFWQSRGGTVTAPSGANPPAGPSQIPSDSAMTVEATSQDTGARPNNHVARWGGTFLWTSPFPIVDGQPVTKLQIHVLGITMSDIDTDLWPNTLVLNPCKEPVQDEAELVSWIKRHQPRAHMVQFKPNVRVADRLVNEHKFHTVHKFMSDHRIYAYAGWRSSSGKFSNNVFFFPIGNNFAGVMFPDGIPDLPGSGNILEAPPASEEAQAQPMRLPPDIVAHLQGLDPAKQQQVLTQLRDQMMRQKVQQAQLALTQGLNVPGMPIPANMHGTVASVPAGAYTNNAAPMNAGSYNVVGRTVDLEMLQSFMQRSAEGSTSR